MWAASSRSGAALAAVQRPAWGAGQPQRQFDEVDGVLRLGVGAAEERELGHHPDHASVAFLLDPEVRPDHQHAGIGTELVLRPAAQAREAGCELLHVDFDDDLAPFYFNACKFRPTQAGLTHLPDMADEG